jgi:hypothetical protein
MYYENLRWLELIHAPEHWLRCYVVGGQCHWNEVLFAVYDQVLHMR